MSQRHGTLDLWKNYDPFVVDSRKDIDLLKKTTTKSKRKIKEEYHLAYKLFFEDNLQYSQIQEMFSEHGKRPFYTMLKLNNPNYLTIKNLIGLDKDEHDNNIKKRKEYQDEYDKTNKLVYVLRGPSPEFLNYYDEFFKNSKGMVYTPSLIYKLRYEMSYDIKQMIEEAKKYMKKVDKSKIDTMLISYPWLVTDKKGSYIVFNTLTELNDAIGMGQYNCDGHIFDKGKFKGCMIRYEKGTNLKNNANRDIKQFLKTLPSQTVKDMRELRNKKYFENYYGGKKLTLWTETYVEMTNSAGKKKYFKQKFELLKYLSKKIKSVGLVPKADRITQILKDGKFLYPIAGGKGKGKGIKKHIDAMPGYTFKIIYKPNGFALDGIRAGKNHLTIKTAIKKGWISMPTELSLKQR
jgi:hypothetical protein